MNRPGPLLVGFLSVAVSAASCTAVDEPGSRGPVRPPTTTTESTIVATQTALHCSAIESGGEELPPDRRAEIDAALLAPEFRGLDMSISIWIEGHGEVAAVNADTALLPASNQKLFTAMGAYSLLDRRHQFTTEVIHDNGVLTLVAGGDPTLRLTGEHSLAALARQTAASGVGTVDTLSVDASHFEFDRMALGWQDWHIPDFVGPLSALTVNDNRYRTDEEFLFGPAVGNLESFADALRTAGVDTGGGRLDSSVATGGVVVASLRSSPMDALVPDMLRRSDNETAEAILREIGSGSTAEGIGVVDAALDALCTDRSGQSGDGSGLSRRNLRSAREWRALLQAAASTPWGADLRAALPTAGRSGTLSQRLSGPTTAGNVMAKTGSIIGGQALSGYARTSDDREMVFSIIVNGDPDAARSARSAIDALVVAAVG